MISGQGWGKRRGRQLVTMVGWLVVVVAPFLPEREALLSLARSCEA
jgi:hypothetical protein